MKTLFYLMIFLFVSNYSYSQKNADEKLQTWMTIKGYICLTDSVNLPKNIKPYYWAIMDTLAYKNPQMKFFYLLKSSIINNKRQFMVSLYSLKSVQQIKGSDDINNKNRENYINGLKDVALKNQPTPFDNITFNIGEKQVVVTKSTGYINVNTIQQ